MRINLSDNERILVVAPHPDDESIGCGGLLNQFRGQCEVLLVTDGVTEDYDKGQLSLTRLQEFESAMEVCGVKEYFMLHIPERQINQNLKKIEDFDFSKYKYVFVPNRYEYHTDHVDTYNTVKKAIKTQRASADLIEYEVWTTIRFPNLYLDISNEKELKAMAIQKHTSQTATLDYVKMILGLNDYRGLTKQLGCAEAYYCETEKKRERIRRIKRKARGKMKK